MKKRARQYLDPRAQGRLADSMALPCILLFLYQPRYMNPCHDRRATRDAERTSKIKPRRLRLFDQCKESPVDGWPRSNSRSNSEDKQQPELLGIL
jgi:hypothetical protein